MPVVSIVIPCYNLGAFLDEAVQSVLDQTYDDFEIIIANDGSSDPLTVRRVKGWEDHPKCRVFHTENQGLPATRNFAITQAKGHFVSCLDADDKLHPKFLSECVAVLEADTNRELGFVTTTAKVFGQRNAFWACSDYDPVQLCLENVVHVASLFRRDCWSEVGGYATNLTGFQDWNFWISIVAKGYRWKLIKRPLFLYRDREGSMLDSSELKRPELKRIIVENNADFFKQHLVEVLDRYEQDLLQTQDNARRQQKEIADLAMAKVKNLHSAYKKLEADYQKLAAQIKQRKPHR